MRERVAPGTKAAQHRHTQGTPKAQGNTNHNITQVLTAPLTQLLTNPHLRLTKGAHVALPRCRRRHHRLGPRGAIKVGVGTGHGSKHAGSPNAQGHPSRNPLGAGAGTGTGAGAGAGDGGGANGGHTRHTLRARHLPGVRAVVEAVQVKGGGTKASGEGGGDVTTQAVVPHRQCGICPGT
jgi:hypothetical protein